MSDKATVAITAEQLQEMMTAVVQTAIAAARKPADPTPEELARKASDEEMRRQQTLLELQKDEERRINQKYCTHRHPNGTSSVARVEHFSPLPNTNFIICVHCQGKIKPAPATTDEKDQYIYDEHLYWTLLGAQNTTTF